jgi:hypothetical protein
VSDCEYKIASWFCIIGIIGTLLIILPNTILKTNNIYNKYLLIKNNKTYYILKKECRKIKYDFDSCTNVESTSVTIAEFNDIYDNIIKKIGDK